MMTKYSQSLKQIAYHEAGHLVADIVFKLNPEKTTIIQTENYQGSVSNDPVLRDFNPYPLQRDKNAVEKVKILRKIGAVSEYDNQRKFRKVARKEMISLLAGYESELKFKPKSKHRPSEGDFRKVYTILDKGGYFMKESEDNSISYPELDKLFKQTKRFTEKYWPEIEKVANLLLEKKELNEGDIKKLSQEILSANE